MSKLPSMSSKELVRVLEKGGAVLSRQGGPWSSFRPLR